MLSKILNSITLQRKIAFTTAFSLCFLFLIISFLIDRFLYEVSEFKLLTSIFNNWYLTLPALIILSYISGNLISKIIFQPIKKISRNFSSIINNNSEKRLNGNATNDEIGLLQKDLNKVLDRLDNSLNQIRRFSSDVSHELRTPLTILQGELEIALNNRQTVEDYEYVLTSALEEVHRLSNVVGSLLELSRADTGQLIIKPETNNLSDILIEVCEDALVMAEEKNISVSKDIERDVYARIDPERIRRALNNLIDNAIKYTQSGGNIRISLKKSRSNILISISDNGIGIEEADLKFIFDRLYRVDKSRAYQSRGAGLGLSIVKWIVDAHDGSIIVNSKIDQGTEFLIDLPAISKPDGGKIDLVLF
jgi:heavy metal sensor kinase